MKRLIKNPIWGFIITVLFSVICIAMLGYSLPKFGYNAVELSTPLAIIGSMILFTSNWFIKTWEQKRIYESKIIDDHIKLIKELGSFVKEINEGGYKTSQVTLIYGLSCLANEHEFLRTPIIKALGDISRWAESCPDKILYNSTQEALANIK